MDDLEDATRLPDDFAGRVRLFPLPGLVVFPHAMQPLHFFEPRYCEMLADAMAGDGLIAMATVDPSVSTIASSVGVNPEIDPTVCIGKIVSHSELEDDRHNVLLVGIRRARIRSELNTGRSFRMADVDVNEDIYPPLTAKERPWLKGKLLESFGNVIPPTQSVQKNLYELMAGPMSLGPITDIVSYMLPFSAEQKLKLLAIANVDKRAETLIKFLAAGDFEIESMSVKTETPRDEGPAFPPAFSLN